MVCNKRYWVIAYLQLFMNGNSGSFNRFISCAPGGDDVLARSIDTLELSVRSRRCMERLAIKTIGQISAKTEAELLGTPNFGQTSLNEVKQKLAELGLSLSGA